MSEDYKTVNYFEPTPKTKFFQWISERHSIYQKRAAGEIPPWTKDCRTISLQTLLEKTTK